MERKTILIANYSQNGHCDYPEDTWDSSTQIENEDDLFRWMKTLHKDSARSFSDYPFGGLFSTRSITFSEQKMIIDDDESVYLGSKKGCENPDYFDIAKLKYDNWYKAIQDRLPKLLEAKKKRLAEEKEKSQLAYLSEKYASTK